MDFNDALIAIRVGCHLTRPKWNGGYVSIIVEPEISYQKAFLYNKIIKILPMKEKFQTFLSFKTADEKNIVWEPTNEDMLADDWAITQGGSD